MKEFTDKLIERLEELKKAQSNCEGIDCDECEYTEICWGGEMSFKVAFDKAISIVNELAEEYKVFGKSEQVNNGWISCSEKLPEEYCEVLVTAKHFEYAQTGFLKGGIWYADDNIKYLADSIIAWQPLPQPYKEGE